MSVRPLSLQAWPAETWLFIGGGALALAIAPVAGGWATPTVWIAALAVAVALAGLPHGALDPWIAYRAGIWRRLPGFIGFNVAYLALAAALAVLWWLLPAVTLGLFLAYAAWHFAGDWQDALGSGWRLVAGVGLLALPAVFHEARVADVFGVLAGAGGEAIARGLAASGPLIVAAYGLLVVTAARHAGRVAVELALLGGLAFALPPLAYFAVYFCLLHSARHLREHFADDEPEQRRPAARVAIVYTLLTVILAAAVWYLVGGEWAVDSALLRLVFIGLAALTVPHMALALYVERRGQAPA